MATASELVFHFARQVERHGVLLVFAVLGLLAVALVGAALIVDLLPPASEPLVSAPIRW